MKQTLEIVATLLVLAAFVWGGITELPVLAASPTPPLPPFAPEMVEQQDGLSPFGKTRLATQETDFSVAAQASGGPDQFGYTWQTGGYDWKDIKSSGTLVNFGGGDEVFTDPISISFGFKFYENTYNNLTISENGLLVLGAMGATVSRDPIPQETPPNNFIAVFWDDLVVGSSFSSGDVYYSTGTDGNGNFFAVEWNGVKRSGSDALLTFQAILYQSGNIKLQYKDMNGTLNQSMVGIEDGDGLDGLLYLYKESGIVSGHAVTFFRPAPAARVKVLSKYLGRMTVDGVAKFSVKIRNTGELGADTYNLSTNLNNSNWNIAFYKSDGVTPLKDTDGNGAKDTGSVPQGATVEIIVELKASPKLQVGNHLKVNLLTTSKQSNKSTTTVLHSGIPTAFVEALADSDIGKRLELHWTSGYNSQKVDDWESGSNVALTDLPSGDYLYAWEKTVVNPRFVPNIDLEYVILSRDGTILKSVTKLTSNINQNLSYWVTDSSISFAPASNGYVGVVWIRDIVDLDNDYVKNSNVFFALLKQDGTLLTSPKNLTNNTGWSGSGDQTVPTFRYPSIQANADNRFMVAWVSGKGTLATETSNVFYGIFDLQGIPIKSASSLTSSVVGQVLYGDPSLKKLANGNILLSYSSFNKSTQIYSILYRVVNSTGGTVKGATPINGTTGYKPHAVQLQNGKVVLAWVGASGGQSGFVLMDSSVNSILKGPITLQNPINRQSDNISLTYDKRGNAILTWMDSMWNNHLFYSLIDGDGNVITTPIVFFSGRALEPYVISNNAGQGNAPYHGWQIYLPLTQK